MKEPFNIWTNIELCVHAAANKKQNLSEIDLINDNYPISFNTLLKNRIKDIRPDGDLLNTALPLGRDRLRQLIEIVQIQMNNYLFNALSDCDNDNEFPEFQFESVDFSGIGNQVEPFVSKSEHTLQKTEAIKSQTDIDNIINHASKKYDVDPVLIKAVIRAESNFDANCTSSKGAMGLMQLMPETAKELGVKNCYSAVENIMAGTCYLKKLLDRYDGNISLALAAYNWGMGNVERHPEKLPKETRTYIARVNDFLHKEIS
ncbi:MAG: lytic transglycosylase domain-containing protein [Thermodesulfobacteriota bacterium]|nr:lytic transglycosylase domain-containing protein [Thermodesulfobacteriota bacterium]